MSIDVSIIIPLYNKDELICQTLKSVSQQSYKDWECLIVDDGSTDNSLKVVERYIKQHPGNWRILRQKNQGQAAARNNGIANATGNFLAFLDADDLWPLDKLTNQVAALIENPNAAVVLSAYTIFGGSNNALRLVRHQSPKRMLMGWLDMSGFGGGLESVGLVRSAALKKIGAFDTNLSTSSGLDLCLRLSKQGEIVLLPEVGLFYRLNPGQWHGNMKELTRNLAIIRERFSDEYYGNLARSHSSYLFWASSRQKGRKYMMVELWKSLLHPSNGRTVMFIRLVNRNIKSVVMGRLEGRKLREILITLER